MGRAPRERARPRLLGLVGEKGWGQDNFGPIRKKLESGSSTLPSLKWGELVRIEMNKISPSLESHEHFRNTVSHSECSILPPKSMLSGSHFSRREPSHFFLPSALSVIKHCILPPKSYLYLSPPPGSFRFTWATVPASSLEHPTSSPHWPQRDAFFFQHSDLILPSSAQILPYPTPHCL